MGPLGFPRQRTGGVLPHRAALLRALGVLPAPHTVFLLSGLPFATPGRADARAGARAKGPRS